MPRYARYCCCTVVIPELARLSICLIVITGVFRSSATDDVVLTPSELRSCLLVSEPPIHTPPPFISEHLHSIV